MNVTKIVPEPVPSSYSITDLTAEEYEQIIEALEHAYETDLWDENGREDSHYSSIAASLKNGR